MKCLNCKHFIPGEGGIGTCEKMIRKKRFPGNRDVRGWKCFELSGDHVFFDFENMPKTPDFSLLKKDEPIFYHPDECDCTECVERRQPGGLDYDPTNDDEEFERHEEEIFDAEIEK